MSRVFVHGEWYERVAPSGMYESEYEHVVLQHGASLFEGFHLMPFKERVESDHGAVKPDLCLVSSDYSRWIVVEVELSTHSFGGHVEPQVLKLLLGDYNRRHAESLARVDDQFDVGLLNDLMKGEQPEVLVIVNTSVPEWEESLRVHDVGLMVFEPFMSEKNKYVFRTGGEIPSVAAEPASMCRRSKVPNILVVDQPGVLPVADGETFRVRYKGGVTLWKRVDGKDAVWLAPHGNFPLEGRGPYELLEDQRGFRFKEVDHDRR